jgi:hypothetical protein
MCVIAVTLLPAFHEHNSYDEGREWEWEVKRRIFAALTNPSDRPSWPGGMAAAKPQTGWLFKFHKEVLGRGVLNFGV